MNSYAPRSGTVVLVPAATVRSANRGECTKRGSWELLFRNPTTCASVKSPPTSSMVAGSFRLFHRSVKLMIGLVMWLCRPPVVPAVVTVLATSRLLVIHTEGLLDCGMRASTHTPPP